ncbi:MAG: acyl-CoA dehydrogenase family protein [Dehalococcoidia bacterium]|nr:acyl-CoA dehydrogenase family protein [Dehalococcoidia bacterium]
MDFCFTSEQDAFRKEIRDFLDAELTTEMRREMAERPEEGGFSPEFSRKLARKGLIGVAWPREYGGKGMGYIERLIYNEEMTYAQAPVRFHHMSERQMGPSIILYGTEEQKKEFLPRITAGDLCFCAGYTEPGAGSDLASLQARAVLDGDDFVVNGQKTYTSGAHMAQYIWLACRTNPDVPKHKGVSVLIVDMQSPGLTVRPLITMSGGRFSEVFFDNVRVPRRNLVGELNQGWYIVASNLDFERSGIERVAANALLFEKLVAYVRAATVNGRRLADDPLVRARLAETAIEFQVGQRLAYRVAWLMSQGKHPNHEASMSKVFGSELSQRVTAIALQVMGLAGQLGPGSRWAPLDGTFLSPFLGAVSDTIRGGTSEVQRNIIASRGLGLPRA